MEEIDLHINSLQTKIRLLIRKYESLKRENNKQREQIAQLEESHNNRAEKLAELEQQNLLFKASLDEMDEEDRRKFDKKINGYIRNIDKCISLLSYNQNP